MYKSLILAASMAAVLPAQAADQTLTFQQGLNGYAGALDTMLRSADAASAYGADDYISVDGDDGSPGLKPNHGLLRFDGLFGNTAGQIRASDTIVSATLTLQVVNPGSGLSLHDMLGAWTENSTWNSLGNGIQADGVEASSLALVQIGANDGAENVPTGALVLDVTASLQAAQAGAVSYGWAMLPYANGTNGIDFLTREYGLVADRPLLSVQVSAVPEPASWALLLSGFGLIGMRLSRRLHS